MIGEHVQNDHVKTMIIILFSIYNILYCCYMSTKVIQIHKNPCLINHFLATLTFLPQKISTFFKSRTFEGEVTLECECEFTHKQSARSLIKPVTVLLLIIPLPSRGDSDMSEGEKNKDREGGRVRV